MSESITNQNTLRTIQIMGIIIFVFCLINLKNGFSALGEQSTRSSELQSPSVLQAVPITRVSIQNGFWADKLKTIYSTTLPDVWGKFETEFGGGFNNFDMIRDHVISKHIGPPWYDGLIYETLRASSDILAITRDPDLDQRLDGYITRIAAAAAQDSNGYINTYTQLEMPDKRWGENGGNEIWQHDIYNSGALVEAAVHHYLATGKTNLLSVAVKLANYMSEYIGFPPRKNIIPGHALSEEAFAKLYMLFKNEPDLKNRLPVPVNEKNYLDLAEFWIEARGNYTGRKSFGAYDQDHKPMVDQETIEGHAVRATLAFNGMTALAMINEREDYYKTVQRIWDNMVSRRMYITGGVGSYQEEEKFGSDYDLPNDGYLETCAAVGTGFFHHTMNRAFADSKYADELERVLYNNILSGVSVEGNTYFYVNPLETKQGLERWSWHGCPCCPPMFLKIIAAFPGYIYAYNERGVYINLYVDSEVSIPWNQKELRIKQVTDYPWEGKIQIHVNPPTEEVLAINIRIPAWSEQTQVRINGQRIQNLTMNRGYAIIERQWQKGDRIDIEIPMLIRKVKAPPEVEADLGRTALMRGPIVFCAEGIDNGGDVSNLVLPDTAILNYEYRPNLLGGVVVIKGKVRREPGPDLEIQQQDFLAIPYYGWANRGLTSMMVWLTSDQMVYSPRIQPGSTIFLDRIKVEMTSRKHAQIHFTLDGTTPTTESDLYSEPLLLDETTTVTAIAFDQKGHHSLKSTSSFTKTEYLQPLKTVPDIKPGLTCEYFRYEGEPDFSKINPIQKSVVSIFKLLDKEEKTHFGYIFSGYIKIHQEGIYSFYSISDDGSLLYINDQKVIDNWGIHGMKEGKGQLALKAGFYTIKVVYYQGGGDYGLEVKFQGPDFIKETIPQEVLFH